MDNFVQIYNQLIVNYGVYSLLLLVAIAVLFCVQMYYYLIVYARIPSFRNAKKIVDGNRDIAVSVVVVVKEDFYYINEVLPKILNQDYNHFEVVVVDLGSNEEFSDALAAIALQSHKIHVTKVRQQQQRFVISNKMALNIGIKAASYQNVIITTVDSCPSSDKWLSFMAKGFASGDVVIGYCGIERKKGVVNRLIRASRLMLGVRYLSSAIRGVVYRGMIQNIGFTKSVYFDANGFNHLNLNIGEDDLFIQKIASSANTSIIMNPHATMRQQQWGGFNWWYSVRKFHGYSYKLYPQAVKNYIQWELGSRLLFFASVIAAAVLLPLYFKIAMAAIVLLRAVIVWFEMWRIRKRLGEGGLAWTLMFYDIFAPITEIRLSIMRTIKPSNGVWR